MFNALEVEKNVMFLILLLIIIVAVFNLISSMIILVSMKRVDIGVLRMLGVKKNQLLKIFIINGSIIGLLGTLIGLFLGLMFCLNINEIKSFIEYFLESNLFSEEIYFFSRLPVIIDFSQILSITLISFSYHSFQLYIPQLKPQKLILLISLNGIKLLNLIDINQKYAQGDSIVEVLSNLCLKINGVKNIGIVGPSGSGKSTLLNILGLIETPHSGEFFFKGKECIKLNNNLKTEIRKNFIGYIFKIISC